MERKKDRGKDIEKRGIKKKRKKEKKKEVPACYTLHQIFI